MNKRKGIVNIVTGKIIGVNPGTREYYHEEGHLKFQEIEDGIRNLYQRDLLNQWIPITLMLAIIYTPLVLISAAIYLVSILLSMREEKWCWDYADKKMVFEDPKNKE